ncbi:MAG: CAP domain-containing protein [Lachnospiraceae bacterium]|nr:CAP domain-containing protein [Lachnospiraceae bacterium]
MKKNNFNSKLLTIKLALSSLCFSAGMFLGNVTPQPVSALSVNDVVNYFADNYSDDYDEDEDDYDDDYDDYYDDEDEDEDEDSEGKNTNNKYNYTYNTNNNNNNNNNNSESNNKSKYVSNANTCMNDKKFKESYKQAKKVVKIVNKERAKRGKSKLKLSKDLCLAAFKRAKETSKVFSHTRPNGKDCFTVLDKYDIEYMACGENIACGQETAEDVMKAWMHSKGHKANILSDKYNKIGVGYVHKNKGYGHYWTQFFTD